MERPSRAGDQLRELRNRLGVTTREVEEFSRTVAETSGNDEFYICNAWLTQLENKDCVPSIYKLFSLSVIYHTRFEDLLAFFGIDLGDSARYQLDVPLANTHLVGFETLDPSTAVTFPIRLDRSFSAEKTSLISRAVEVWGQVPISLIQQLDVRHTQYGYIGLGDFMMYPLLRPGTFVQINSELADIQSSAWRTEFDRPIYFIELRDSYACSWCELSGSQLTLLPHPLSACATRQFAYPDEAEIVGQVTAVAMRLVSVSDEERAGAPGLPKRP
jgi:transcriptional regulator with XRE-family HTH domain